MKKIGIITLKKNIFLLLCLILLSGCASEINQSVEQISVSSTTETTLTSDSDDETNYTIIEVDACDITTKRKPNAKVDIGFGDKVYWAYTNEYAQLIRVTADEIYLQDEEKEVVNEKGRYCNDIANVPGTELKQYQRGHVLADSLSGNASVYNITPQDSYLNMHGNQAYMEDQIRKALKAGLPVTDFEAIITYPDTETQIPDHYKYTYKINGELIVDEFDNVDPRSVPVKDNSAIIDPDFSDEEKYILNTNSKKIHKVNCESIGKISNNNKKEYVGNINELINEGYEPCKICNPK